MKISFHGAAREVTGSCHLLTLEDKNGVERRILIDCGMFQGESYADERNRQPFGFDPASLDAVCITHAHADHTGRLPKLIKEGYTKSIFMTPPTCALARVILEDAYEIMQDDARRNGDIVLYEKEDVQGVMKQSKLVGYHEEVEIAPGISFMFHDAGHILGSAFITFKVLGKQILFSGDIGNDDVPILPSTEAISHADIVVCESTYGSRLHEKAPERTEKLITSIKQIITNGGVLLIPSFSIERTQELLYELNNILLHELKTNIPIFLDSPMAIRATQLYRDYKTFLQFDMPIFSDPDGDFFSFPNLRETLTVDASKHINEINPPKIIIAGSGMMSGGRIMHHLPRYLSNPKNLILIIGYLAKGTLGRRIYEREPRVKIYGEWIQVKAGISAIGAFSAHGDQEKLTRWLLPEDQKIPEKIFLVHGDPEEKEVFATHLHHRYQTEIIIPEFGSVHEL